MTTEQQVTIYGDGGSRNNPGDAAYGFVVYEKGQEIYKEGKRIGIATNNVAEYSAVIGALKWVKDHKKDVRQIDFFLDSALAVNQLTGRFKVKNEHLRDLYFTVKSLEKIMQVDVSFTAIPREKNTAADKMVNMALDNLL